MSRNLIKEIEKYFLKCLGSGVMLSSKDYTLIKNWEDRGADIETIKKGILLAFQSGNTDIRSVYQCRYFVENLLTEKNAGFERENNEKNSYPKQLTRLEGVIKRIDSLLKEEKKEEIKRVYSFCKEELCKLLYEKKKDIFEELQKIEDKFYESFFSELDKNLALAIEEEAKSLMPSNASFLSREVEEDTAKVIRNEIIKKKFNIPDFFGFEND